MENKFTEQGTTTDRPDDSIIGRDEREQSEGSDQQGSRLGADMNRENEMADGGQGSREDRNSDQGLEGMTRGPEDRSEDETRSERDDEGFGANGD